MFLQTIGDGGKNIVTISFNLTFLYDCDMETFFEDLTMVDHGCDIDKIFGENFPKGEEQWHFCMTIFVETFCDL
jgi:hypothetical protein